MGESIHDLKIQLELSLVRNYDIDWDTASLIVQDDLLDRRDPKKMTSLEKLELIKHGRKKHYNLDQCKLEIILAI